MGATKVRRKTTRHARRIAPASAHRKRRLRLSREHTEETPTAIQSFSSCRLAYASDMKSEWRASSRRGRPPRIPPTSAKRSLGASSIGSPRRVGYTRQAMRLPLGGEPSSTMKSISMGSVISFATPPCAPTARRVARRMKRSTRHARNSNKWDRRRRVTQSKTATTV
jgi:hypothetical protein